jgi:photosystem II stability/assembly factor-like uncharacterized protein
MQNLMLPRLLSVMVLAFTLCLTACGGGVTETTPASSGPSPDWSIIGPGGGGSTFFPTYHPTDPDRIAIRCDMTGCYLSDNGGQSWEMYNIPGSVSSFAFDPSENKIVYVGAAGLHRTTDFGKSWELIFPLPSDTLGQSHFGDHADFDWVVRDGASYPGGNSHVDAILIDPQNPQNLYVGLNFQGSGSVFVTRDNGASWSELARLKAPILGLYADLKKIDKLYAITRSSLAEIDPASGESDEKDMPERMTPVESATGGVDPESGVMRFYGVVTPKGTAQGGFGGKILALGGIFVTEDAGENWREVSGSIPKLASIPAEDVKPSFAWVATASGDSRTAYVVCAHFADINPRGETGHWYGIVKTTDSGKNWTWVQKAGGGSAGYGVRDGFKAENMKDSWVNDAFGNEFCRAICIGVFPSDPSHAVFTDWYRSMKTSDGGESWHALYSETLPDGSIRSRGLDVTTTYGVHFDPFDPEHIAISYTDIGYWHSFNSGTSWLRSADNLPDRWHNTCYWLEFDPDVEGRIVSGWGGWHDLPKLKMIRTPNWRKSAPGGVCVSNDGGRTWEVSSDGLPNSPVTWVTIDPESPSESRTLYATSFSNGVYKSIDGGASWNPSNNGLGENLNAFQVTLDKNGTLWLVVTFDVKFSEPRELLDGAVYRSDDGASSWQKVELPAAVKFPNSIESDPLDPNRLYLACWASVDKGDYRGGSGVVQSEGGVLASTDNGKTWTQVYEPDTYVYGVAADPRQPGRVYLNTFQHRAAFSTDFGANWSKMAGYDFHWGHRPVPDPYSDDKVYLTTFGGSVYHGTPIAAQ